ncbi:MAG: hypothetical protein LBD11_05815 [Candidatus Peribacteria bacterium]|jgi:hypothetical protein|nr:hypothetical protein [Candidatus Peribacteria bacterium]
MIENITCSETPIDQQKEQTLNQEKKEEIYTLAYTAMQIDSFLNWIENNKATLKEDRNIGSTLEKKWKERNQLDYRLLRLEQDNGEVYRQRRFPLGTNRLSPEEYLALGDESITFKTAQEAVEFSDFVVMKNTFRKVYQARIDELLAEIETEEGHNRVNQISAQIK